MNETGDNIRTISPKKDELGGKKVPFEIKYKENCQPATFHHNS
jgi:hypothetical protein